MGLRASLGIPSPVADRGAYLITLRAVYLERFCRVLLPERAVQ